MKQLLTFFKGDRSILVAIAVLVIFSATAVYSSTSVLAYQKAGGNTFFYLARHAIMLLCGVGILGFTSRVKPNYVLGLSPLMLLAGIVLLVLTMLVGSSVNGSSRWLNLGFISFQPSEFAKIALILYVAKQLASHQGNPDDAFLKIMGATVIVCGIIMFENLSTCLLVAGSVFILMFIARISWVKLVGTAVVAGGLVASIIFFAPLVSKVFPRANTWRARVERYIDDDDARAVGANYQAEQAKAAVSTGGVLGKGFGNSYMKNFLPMAFSDFIFSIILEESGLWGCFLVLACYFVIFARSRLLAVKAIRDGRCSRAYMILGLSIMLTLQAFINMMVGVGLIPVTGQTLPMVSMGGTSNFITGFALGIILCVSEDIADPSSVRDLE